MKFLSSISIASLVAVASSTAIPLNKRDSVLDIQLTAEENSIIRAAITNTGSVDLNIFKHGTFLDSAPIEKVTVSSVGTSSTSLPLRFLYLHFSWKGTPAQGSTGGFLNRRQQSPLDFDVAITPRVLPNQFLLKISSLTARLLILFITLPFYWVMWS
jgi:hypothetical protein